MGEFNADVSIIDQYPLGLILSRKENTIIDSGHHKKANQRESYSLVYKDLRPIEVIRRNARGYADLLDGIGNYQ